MILTTKAGLPQDPQSHIPGGAPEAGPSSRSLSPGLSQPDCYQGSKDTTLTQPVTHRVAGPSCSASAGLELRPSWILKAWNSKAVSEASTGLADGGLCQRTMGSGQKTQDPSSFLLNQVLSPSCIQPEQGCLKTPLLCITKTLPKSYLPRLWGRGPWMGLWNPNHLLLWSPHGLG